MATADTHLNKLSLNFLERTNRTYRSVVLLAESHLRSARERHTLAHHIQPAYPLAPYRVIGVVRNMDAWYAAFDITPGDVLYLPPEERVRTW